MAIRSFIAKLPSEIRNELDKRLITSAFCDYEGHSAWLIEKGHKISRQAVQEYGQKLESRLANLKLSHDFALLYKQQLPEDTGAKSELLNDLAQSALLSLLLRLPETNLFNSDDKTDLNYLSTIVCKITRAISDINKTNIVVTKYADDLRARQEAKFSELEADGRASGISEEFMARMRTEVLGMN